ncbi:unnamed protein product [Amaranthus hypochondriacus]
MGERKEEDLYRKFSRKDLQGLCKKYGLPANKSNSEMATSLILYLEMKNVRSKAIWEGTRTDAFASGTTELQTSVRMNLTDDLNKDCGHMASHSCSGNNQHYGHQDAQLNNFLNGKGSATSNKASEEVGILTQLNRGSNSDVGIENTFSSVVSSSVVAPSPTFTFDVCCEDGIQLHVDLDSSPADWIENLKSGIHICHDVHKPMSQSFHQDIGLLCCKQKHDSFMDQSKETENGKAEVGPCPATLADNQARIDNPDVREDSMSSPGLKSLCNAVRSLENSKEKANLSSILESGIESKVPGVESSVREEMLATDSDVNAVIQKSTSQTETCNNTGNSVPSDSKSLVALTHQSASDVDGICENSSFEQTCGSLDAVLRSSKLSTNVQASPRANTNQDLESFPSEAHRCVDLDNSVQTSTRDELQTGPALAVDQRKSVSCLGLNNHLPDLAENSSKEHTQYGTASFFRKSDRQIREGQTLSADNTGFLGTHDAGRRTDELQQKVAAVHPCSTDGSIDVPNQNGEDRHISTEPDEVREDVCTSASTMNVRDMGTGDTGNRREVVEFLKDRMEEPCKKLTASESNGKLKRKRHFNHFEGQSKFVNTEAKILRSSKQFVGDVHSKRRRSSRLFTK